MFLPLIYTICFVALLVASVFDIKTREVPDWINYSLVFIGLGTRLIFSFAEWDFSYILDGAIGMLVFLALAYLMFYTGQWGGGDSKMIIGLGALLGFNLFNLSLANLPFIVSFFINMLFVGAAYGLVWSLFLVLRNRKRFSREFRKTANNKKYTKPRRIMTIVSIILLLVLIIIPSSVSVKLALLSLAVMLFFTPYLLVFIRAVETSGMHKLVDPSKLTEGDWIVKDVRFKGKYICGPKDLGIEKKQIKQLIALKRKGKIKKVLIKEGIPFVPSFFLAFVVTVFYGNVLMLLF